MNCAHLFCFAMKPSTCHHLIFIEKSHIPTNMQNTNFSNFFFSNERDGYMKDVMNDVDVHKLQRVVHNFFRATA